MNLKEKRHEIYDLIEEHIGKIDKNILVVLSEKLQEYVKLHNKKQLDINRIMQNSLTRKRKSKKAKQEVKPKQEAKPKKEEKLQNFNYDFIK